jgi:hypothetical protein
MTNGKILIAGTGRAGTSFLMRLLTRCGFDTGFTPESDGYNESIRAGCELQWGQNMAEDPPLKEWLDGSPRIIKSPFLSLHLPAIIEGGTKIDYVIVPVRELTDATKSRLHAGLAWQSTDFATELDHLNYVLTRCIDDCLKLELPFKVLTFPRHVKDSNYLVMKLAEVFEFSSGDAERVIEEHRKLNSDLTR